MTNLVPRQNENKPADWHLLLSRYIEWGGAGHAEEEGSLLSGPEGGGQQVVGAGDHLEGGDHEPGPVHARGLLLEVVRRAGVHGGDAEQVEPDLVVTWTLQLNLT